MFPIIQMRYSFFGQSGWRSDASQQMELLFDPGRLQHRFNLLQQIAMPSLVAQQDRDFGLVVLTSADLPRPHLTALTEFVGDMLGDRAEVIARKPSSAHRQFMRFNKENFAPDQTKVVGKRLVRVLAWYDNEWGFSARMADVAAAMGRLLH